MKEKNTIANFGIFASKRIIVGILLLIASLWVMGTILGFYDKSSKMNNTDSHDTDTMHAADVQHSETPVKDTHAVEPLAAAHVETKAESVPYAEKTRELTQTESRPKETAHAGDTLPQKDHTPTLAVEEKTPEAHTAAKENDVVEKTGHDTQMKDGVHDTEAKDAGHGPALPVSDITGATFIQAAIKPLDYELNERAWGWRPNDIVNITDNVNNFQLGVLEVTRRTAVVLSERLSRTGITAAIDKNLENATNWLMIKPDRYIFPSAETKYNDSLDEIRLYLERLENKKAKFYTRSDNLLPLLSSYVELLGSCDENLAKMTEEDGSQVSYFKSDDYFFYAQGVASSLYTILQAIAHDFSSVIETRHGADAMHHAILSCHHAMEIDPWLILEGGLSSIFANHRANMAAPISHAGFYLRVLITTLST